MSDSESERPSSECSWEGEATTSRGRQLTKKRKAMSSSSEGEEGEEEEEEEQEKQQPVSSRGVGAEFSEGEEEEGAVGPVQKASPPALNEDSSASSSEGDDDGDSADSDSSSEVPGAETCAICLGRMRGEVGSPESCDHTFCLICILEWAKTNASCPQDRKAFSKVLVRVRLGAEDVEREVVVQKEESEVVLLPEADNPTYCEVCHECDREERLLLCDGCDLGYHLECLDPPLVQVPVEEWFCPVCASANIPSMQVSVQPVPQEGESSSTRRRRIRQQSSSQRPRLIPRTRATERVRERVIRKRREKRKRRRQSRKRRIESGELDDPRPSVQCKERLLFFGNLDTSIPSEDMDDNFADHLLATGSGWSSSKNPVVRKADAAKVLRDSAFTPLSSYAGKASSAVINRVNTQAEETREDDVLSSILEKQSIVLTNSKQLSLTSDRKLKKDGERNEAAESFSLEQEELPLMSEPLPSRRPPPKDGEGSRSTSQEDDRRHSSPPRGPFHSRYAHHSSFSRNSSYGHPLRGYEPNRRTQREERVFREERIQREERLSGAVHYSPLEDRRRSPPRLSYQRQGPSYQYRNQRNFNPDHRNRDPPSHRDERPRYQRSPPWRDSGHRQNQSGESRWERRNTESSGSSSREPSSQERHGRNGKDSSRDLNSHDKYSRRNEDSEKHPRKEDDRSRKEDRGYHRHHHHRDHSDHRSYKSSRADRESPPSHSSRRSRSYSRSPVRSRSPNRSRSPFKSKSPLRSRSPIRSRSPTRSEAGSSSREIHSRGQEDSRRRRNAHKPSNESGASHRMSLSPALPEEASTDDKQQGSQRDTSEYDSVSDAKLSPLSSKCQEPPAESPVSMFDDTVNKERPVEDKLSSLKNEVYERDKSRHLEESPKASRWMKKEWDVKQAVSDIHCNSSVADQRHVTKGMNREEEKPTGSYEDNSRCMDENKVNGRRMETSGNLLKDAKRGDDMVQTSCKGEHKRDKPHKDVKTEDSRKNRNGYDAHPLLGGDCSEDTDKKQQQDEAECAVKEENNLERKKRKRLIPGILGRILPYTPEVELSHWDDEDSSTDSPSPFKVIKKSDAGESDKSITLPLSLQRLLPGSKSILEGIDNKNKTSKEKPKHKPDPDRREEEGGDPLCDEVLKPKPEAHKSKTEAHDTQRPDKRDGNSIIKKEKSCPWDKSHKKSTEGHKPTKADAKLHNNKSKDAVSSPSSSQGSSSSGKSKEKSSEKAPAKESHSLIPQRRDSSTHSDSKEKERDHKKTKSSSHMPRLAARTPEKHKEKKESSEKVKSIDMFGDISDISGSESGEDERKKPVKESCVVAKNPEKQKVAQEKKDEHVHGKTTGAHGLSDTEMKTIKCDTVLDKGPKEENVVAPGLTSSPPKTATKSKSPGKITKNTGLNKDHVLDLFGSTSDSDDAESPEVKSKETSVQKTPEKPHKSLPLKGNSAHRKARESAGSGKGKERKSEQGTTHEKKAVEKLPNSTSSESPKSESVQRNGNETTDSHTGKDRSFDREISLHKLSTEEQSKPTPESPKAGVQKHKSSKEPSDNHKRKDRKGEQESSHHKKPSEKPSHSTSSELPRGNSSHKKNKEATDTQREKNKKCEKETSPHKKSSEDATQGETEAKKRKETTDSHKEEKERHAQETLKKVSEKPPKATTSEHHDSSSDRRKTEAADTHNEEPWKGKTSSQAAMEDCNKTKSRDPADNKGKTHSSKERKSSTEEKNLREKDLASKTESKQSAVAASSLHPTSHASDKKEKKEGGDSYAKQLKASLELKVVTEVKRWLDPHYRDKNITKDEYKEIVAKCVNKVVSAECGDVIESEKMRTLVEGYVKLYRHRRAKQQPPP